jgi:hypothetical protein
MGRCRPPRDPGHLFQPGGVFQPSGGQGCGGYASGPEFLTTTGQVIWFHPLPAGETATDFRTQTYQGRPVLTWFQGRGLDGTDYIYNDRYRQIAEVRAGHGYFTDFHEFLITPWNTAIGNGEYTVFDDESGGGAGLLPYSRVVTVRLNLAAKVATLVKSVKQPEGLVAGAEGNAQTTRDGDLFVGWGALPYISEFSPSGHLLFNPELPAGVTTYCA